MDPTANLREQLVLSARIRTQDDLLCADPPPGAVVTHELSERIAEDASRLAELVEALDVWISKGGFLPLTWRRIPR